MRFTRWYPVSEVATNAPTAPGMIQVRLASGLINYPRGKSAMVHYAVGDDVRAVAMRFVAGYRGVPLWCRHLDPEGEVLDVTEVYTRLVREFENRFGRPPSLPES